MFEELFDAAPVGLGMLDRDLRWVRVNPCLAEMSGRPGERMLGRRPGEIHGDFGASSEALMRRVLETGEPLREVEESGNPAPAGDVERHWRVTYYPVVEEGEVVGVGVIVTDDTDRRRAEAALDELHARDAILARAGRLLATTRSVEDTAQQTARLIVPSLADWCFVELLQEDGTIERTAMVHRDPVKERWVRELDARYPLDPESPIGSPKVIRTGEPELLEEIPDEMLVQAAVDEDHLRLLREAGMCSALVVPLIARGRVIGDLALVQAESGRRFGPGDLDLARALAARCALALDSAREYERRAEVALTLQEALLPRRLPDIPGIEVAARYNAAGAGNDVGGDFYDVFPAHDGWNVIVGDVAGKGPAAAGITGLARHTLRAAAAYERSPAALLRVLNRALVSDEHAPLATVVCVHLRPGHDVLRARVASAGHPLPLAVRADGRVEPGGRYGHMLGVEEEPELHDVDLALERGESLVLFTDGVTEAGVPRGSFGEASLQALLAEGAGDPPARLVERIERAVLAASQGRPRDDVAIVALRSRSNGA